jgi:nucleoside triphosphate diphosphatase
MADDTSGTETAAVEPGREIERLIAIMAALRTPVTGCPWDLEQSFATIAPYTVEEAYEVADAIERGDFGDLREELGDLLLQVVYHARLGEEQGLFDFGDVVEAITRKLIRRHPHVFGKTRSLSPAEVKAVWAGIKAKEKKERAERRRAATVEPTVREGLLADVPAAMPGLTRAVKLQAKAGTVGFDWNDVRTVLAKVREEAEEVAAEIDGAADPGAIEAEIGDLLFAVANLARHAKVDPEAALRGANAKFERRFTFIERALAAAGRMASEASLEEMDALWEKAKAEGL